ncbi:hypothetical protein [Nocardioides sp. SYSU D00065]|uniref:hypothetical protein n=1 Tax=Nocardioides sp. SYSU D00065 TaxID=2817378 RepID=UPI001B31FB06|nr:hypothetical protein [Nocardioides sp. SYSU D00065]
MTSTTMPALRRVAALTTATLTTAALAAGPLSLAPSHAAAAKADAYKVTAKANLKVAIGKEDTIKVRGRVTPKAAGEKVILQQRVAGKQKWRATGSAKVKSSGAYVLEDDPSTPGMREYRVVKPASDGLRRGVSKALPVQVYAWQSLASRLSGARVNLDPGTVMIAADSYSLSLATATSGTPASVEYTLGRKCTDLRATYALTDDSATGSTGRVTVTSDGTVVDDHALAVGTVVAGSLDVTGVFRLRFDLTTSATPAATAAIATPEVLCTR